jgi:hypothetical protein
MNLDLMASSVHDLAERAVVRHNRSHANATRRDHRQKAIFENMSCSTARGTISPIVAKPRSHRARPNCSCHDSGLSNRITELKSCNRSQRLLKKSLYGLFRLAMWRYRKLPCQGDSLKVEFSANCVRYSAGVRLPSESWGRSSLYSIIHQ